MRANVVCPGMVDTPMFHTVLGAGSKAGPVEWEAGIPLGRLAAPSEIAAVIAHLTSEQASDTNGLVYVVDGRSAAGYFTAADETA